jgi:release factor glutamine methyltransferase
VTRREAVLDATKQLAASHDLQATAARDAEVLLLHALHISRATLFAHPDREISVEELALYRSNVARRLTDEPIQYVVGEQEFYGLALRVTPAVLIPRPETEHLVEAVLALLPNDRALRILDVGTGSGAIAIALAVHLPQAEMTAVDLSAAALEIATANARAHGVEGRIRLLEPDLLGAVVGERFDAVVSNPPYIPEGDRSSLHAQVREYEPAAALFAGASGLDIYERLIPQAHDALRVGGLLAMEIGSGQHEAIAALLRGWEAVRFVEDLQGIPRVALARRAN